MAAVPPPIVLKSLSKWAVVGLDLTDTGFSKLYSKESHYSDDKPKYDLQPERFEEYKNELIEKVNRMNAIECFTGIDENNDARFLLKEYTLLTQESVEDMRELTWPDGNNLPAFADQAAADRFTDKQIKNSCIGTYIHDSLTEAAKKQLRAQRDQFMVTGQDENEYFDGPSYFFLLAELVDPDNTHMIENVRKELRSLDVKNFGYSIIKMLAEFKTLTQRIDELGGRYDQQEQFLDFWDCLKTMKEKEFSRYVRQEKDRYRKQNRANRDTLETYMRDMTKKEVAMKEDSEWNVVSAEDTMIMALVSTLEKTVNKKITKPTKSKSTNKDDDKDKNSNTELSAEERAKRRDAKIPEWKKKAPTSDEEKTITKDSKTYHYCKKCRNGESLWALHNGA